MRETVFNANKSLITGSTLWNDADFTTGRCTFDEGNSVVYCSGSVGSSAYSYGDVFVSDPISHNFCKVQYDGKLNCKEY